MPPPYEIIDSHIHLYPSTHLSTLAWMTPTSPLSGQYSVSEYKSSVSHSQSATTSLRGFVFLETDRISSLTSDNDGWRYVAEEIKFLSRIALGEPVDGEGHEMGDRQLCSAIVPWAPVPAGAEIMKSYLEKVKEWSGSAFGKMKGFRYLVQDKPSGTMLTREFGEGLDFLGREGLTFDLGIDIREARGGLWQSREAVEMVERIITRAGGEEEKMVTIVISTSFLLNSMNVLFSMLINTFSHRPHVQTRHAPTL
jgi:L-rhamnono-1,4-lactonase